MKRFNRHHYFGIGIILLLLGLNLRAVDTFYLNEPATEFVQKRFGESSGTRTMLAVQSFMQAAPSARSQTIQPPRWLGWSLISIGSVLILHSIPMKGPGG